MAHARIHTVVASAAIALAATFGSGLAHADNLVVNVAGIQSIDEEGSALNVIKTYNLGEGAHITSLAWNVTLTANSPSWLEELAVSFSSSTGDGIYFTPGIGDTFSGTSTYAGSADLTSLGLDFLLGSNGLLTLEFFETFDDFFGGVDGTWTAGSLTFGYTPGVAAVPEPGTYALLFAGLGVVGWAARRRQVI